MLMKLLFMGIDIIGLVTTGIAAKQSKTFIGPLLQRFGSSTGGLTKASKASPKFKGLLETMMTQATSAKSSMGKVASYLKTKSPMLYKFVSSILGGLGSIVAKLISVIKSVLGITGKVLTAPGKAISKGLGSGKLGAGAKTGFETTAIVGGLGTHEKMSATQGSGELIKGFSNAKPSFDGI